MSFSSYVNELFNVIYQWLQQQWQAFENSAIAIVMNYLTEQIRTILNGVMQFIATGVHDVEVAITEFKFHFNQDLQKFYNTTVGFWVIVIGTFVAAVYVPQILSWAIKAAAKTKIYAWIIKISGDVKSWAGWQQVNALVEMNRIAQVLFQNWRAMWTGIYQDVGQIASDLGFGTGAVSALLTATKGLLTSFYTVMGADPTTAETTMLSKMSSYLAGLTSNFNKYAQNPQDIWNDLWGDVILPQQQQVHDYFANIDTKITDLNNAVEALSLIPGQFTKFQGDLETVLNLKLSKAQATEEAKILQEVNQEFTNYNETIGSKIDEINKAIGPLEQAIQKHNNQIADNATSVANATIFTPASDETTGFADLTNLLGADEATQIGYLSSQQADNDIQTFFGALVVATKVVIGGEPDEIFTEYVNQYAVYESPVVNPVEV